MKHLSAFRYTAEELHGIVRALERSGDERLTEQAQKLRAVADQIWEITKDHEPIPLIPS